MIESNVIEWLDFGDSIQKIDSYSRWNLIILFRFYRELVKNKFFPRLEILFMVIFFIQLLSISSVFENSENDIILEILKYLKIVLLLFEMKMRSKVYIRLFNSTTLLIFIDVILMVISIFIIKIKQFRFIAFIINIFNIIIFYYLLGPALEINLMTFWCENGQHKFIKRNCFSDTVHIWNASLSIINIILYILVSLLYSIYCNEIGSITLDIKKKITRIYCNYEIFCLIIKVTIFFLYFILILKNNLFICKIIYESVLLVLYIIMVIYIYNYVYYYNNMINYIVIIGWSFSSWFSLNILLKIIFNINKVSSSIIIGWIIIVILLVKEQKMKEILLITKEKIFEFSSIKSMEMFINILIQKLQDKNNFKSKILLYGFVKNFDEYRNNNSEINNYYQKLLNDKYLYHKFNKNLEFLILAIIYIIYSVELGKPLRSQEVSFYMSYFLINKLNNATFAILLCSKLKGLSHKGLYYKYLLSEEIKENLIIKLNNPKKDSIKHVQIGSIILYYLYIDLFKMKIYDAMTNQIDYFDLLENNFATNKTTKIFLKTGEMILKTKKEIMTIWEKLTELNPFSDEIFKDYILYLESILQDEILSKEESKKYTLLKNKNFNERFNIYHSLFINDTSSILLVDGYLFIGRILYTSQNFPSIYKFNSKELLNININDLLPNVIQMFHKELIDNSIRYSNYNFLFKKNRDSLLKNKNGGLVNIELFIKPTPNLSYGLTFLTYIKKIQEPRFVIILDKDLKINSFTQTIRQNSSFELNLGYYLNNKVIGYHISVVIPDILPLLEFKNDEFNIIKKNCELKGFLYNTIKINEIKSKIEIILEKIKNNTSNNNNIDNELQIEENFQLIKDNFNEIIEELNNEKVKPLSIFYRVQLHSFLGGKYKYYRIYLSNDIITESENIPNSRLLFVDNNSKILKNSDIKLSGISKISKESEKRIKIGICKNKSINNNIEKIEEKNNIENQKKTSYNDKDKSNNNKNKEMEEEKKTTKKLNVKLLGSQSNITNDIFYNLKLKIINKKETLQIKIMKILGFFFLVVSISFMIFDENATKNSFINLSSFLGHNIYFNMTKMNIAALFIASTNIKWQTQSCERSSKTINLTFLYEKLIYETIDYLLDTKNETNNFDQEYKNILEKRHETELTIYGTKSKEKYQFNLDNLLTFFVNSGINVLNNYNSFLERLNLNPTKSIDPQTIGLDELFDFVEQTYLYFISDIDGFKGEEKNDKISKFFKYFYLSLICCGLIFIFLFFSFCFLISQTYKIELYFLNKLVNFHSLNFTSYIKKLNEIKKKLKNDNNDEEDKEEIIDETNSKKNHKKEEKEVKKNELNEPKNPKKNKKKDEKKRNLKIEKIEIMKKFFFKTNVIFEIKMALIMIIIYSYFIISILMGKNNKLQFLTFDSINDEIIGIFKESFDIYIFFKRELDLYQETLTNCKLDNSKETYIMKIPKFSEIKTPNLGNTIMQIIGSKGFKKETLTNFIQLFNEDACTPLSHSEGGYRLCSRLYNGIITKGMEQTITKMSSIVGSIIEELESLNMKSKTFNEVIQTSTLNTYESFIGFYYIRTYLILNEIFNNFREEKLFSIINIQNFFLIAYVTISILLFGIFYYFIYSYKNIFNSFLNFIAILPIKLILEDENFYKEILKFGEDYF